MNNYLLLKMKCYGYENYEYIKVVLYFGDDFQLSDYDYDEIVGYQKLNHHRCMGYEIFEQGQEVQICL